MGGTPPNEKLGGMRLTVGTVIIMGVTLCFLIVGDEWNCFWGLCWNGFC